MVLQEQTANMQNYDVLSGEIQLFAIQFYTSP